MLGIASALTKVLRVRESSMPPVEHVLVVVAGPGWGGVPQPGAKIRSHVTLFEETGGGTAAVVPGGRVPLPLALACGSHAAVHRRHPHIGQRVPKRTAPPARIQKRPSL